MGIRNQSDSQMLDSGHALLKGFLLRSLHCNRENSLIFVRIFRPRPRPRRRPRLGANQVERNSLCRSDIGKFANAGRKGFEDEDDDEGRGRFGYGCLFSFSAGMAPERAALES